MSWSAAMHFINCYSKTNKWVICQFVCIYRYTTCVGQGIGNSIVQGTKVLNPSPNFVVSNSITIKFGVLIEFDKFSPNIDKKVSKMTSLNSYDVIFVSD